MIYTIKGSTKVKAEMKDKTKTDIDSKEMLFLFKDKYHYTYLNTYIALHFSYAKVTCNTHKQLKEFGFHPSYARSLIS